MRLLLSLLFFPLFVIGCAQSANLEIADTDSLAGDNKQQDPASELRHEDLDAVLWVQTSGEYQAITRQTYRLASIVLDVALEDKTWTASKEQEELAAKGEVDISRLPPAVILDVDETVLDNSKYQVQLIKSQQDFTPESWKKFCQAKVSTAVPGSVEFVKTCLNKGIKVFFLTNRESPVEPSTRENLISVGLLNKFFKEDNILTKYEKPDWKSDKETRRLELAKKYRILQLIGDDLHDFASTGKHPQPEERQQFATDHVKHWGTKWIVLPNPNYGGWERAAHGWNDKAKPKKKLELKRERLEIGAGTVDENASNEPSNTSKN